MRFFHHLRSLVSLFLGLTVAGGIVGYSQNAISQGNAASNLRNYGPAPELDSLAWLNSDKPLRLEHLRGQVVLLEFWTFDCINCIHTLPYVENWHQTYGDHGLTVIGIHYPEFYYEHDLQHVLAATQRLNVTYPVGIDNQGTTWRAYNQQYWPTLYLIDKQGNLRYVRIGEGAYETTESAIQSLLAETFEPVETASPAQTSPPLVYLRPDEVLNVRAAPGIENALIGSIQPGMAFVILDEQAGWYQIAYNDGLGYVSGEYVTVFEESEPIN